VASRAVLEALRASVASAAYPVALVVQHPASVASVAYPVGRVGLHQVAWAAWVALGVGQEALGVSHRSSFIPQHRSGATSSWTHVEHITILQR